MSPRRGVFSRRKREGPAWWPGLSLSHWPLPSPPEQRQQDDDRKWNAEQPKQCASSETHVVLLWFVFRQGEQQSGLRVPGAPPRATTDAGRGNRRGVRGFS